MDGFVSAGDIDAADTSFSDEISDQGAAADQSVIDANNDESDADAVEVLDASDTFDEVDTPDIDPQTLAWPALCLPANTTATTVGPVGPVPEPCEATECAACGAQSKCTCAGDGATPCAWTAMAPMKYPRVHAAGVVGDDGRIYIFSGSMNHGYPTGDPDKKAGLLANGEIHDPATGTWTLIPPAPIYPDNFGVNPVAWGGGKLWVAGMNFGYDPVDNPQVALPWGPDYAGYAVYDPTTGMWAALPKAGSPGGCGTWDMLAWLDNKLIAMGCKGAFKTATNPPSSYDPDTGEWTPLPPLPAPGYGLGMEKARTIDGHLLWLQNSDSQNPARLFDFDSQTWKWTVHPMPSCAPKWYPERVAAINGGYFMWGGYVPAQWAVETGQGKNEAWIWWLGSQTWEAVPVPAWLDPMYSRGLAWTGTELALVQLVNPANNSAVYDPTQRAWRQLAGLASPTAQSGQVTLGVGPKIFVIGGEVGSFQVPTKSVAAIIVPAK